MRRYQPKKTDNEVELDLAPLLSIMVKLVPVLLLSSAFVQVMVIETDLPQAVQQVIEQNQENPTAAIQLNIDPKEGFRLVIQKGAEQQTEVIPMKDQAWDLNALHLALVKAKQQYPEVFKIEFNPAASVPYKDLVRMMDEVRKAKDPKTRFEVINKKDNSAVLTEFMFPDVVFTNVMDG
jgi:biopolymer transport protein ExbD